MRIKSVIATHMSQAMHRLREDLGEDAVIVSTREAEGGGVFVTAAADSPVTAPLPLNDSERPSKASALDDSIHQILERHRTPRALINRLVDTADALGVETPLMALAGSLDTHFLFRPLLERKETRPMIFVGLPGSGKTVTVARLAAETVMRKHTVSVVSADTDRAGGIEQLSAFTSVLDVPTWPAEDATALTAVIGNLKPVDLVLIDSPACNPFDPQDIALMNELVKAADAEPVLVLAAGSDVADSIEVAQAFAELGANRMIVTRLDISGRLGSVLAAADAAGIAFSGVSIARQIAHSLHAVNPVSLSRLLATYNEPVIADPRYGEAVQ